MPAQTACRPRLSFAFSPLLLSLVLATGCSGEVELEGPRVGESGCPAHLEDLQSIACDEGVSCSYYTDTMPCVADWSCDANGKWWSLLSCLMPSDGSWCHDPVTLGDDCLFIELSCPRNGPITSCGQPTPMALCGPDYVWEAAPDQPPTCGS